MRRNKTMIVWLTLVVSVNVASVFVSVAQVPAPSGSASPAPVSSAESQDEALAKLRQRLVGHETEPAEQVFENIELLRGRPASRLPGMMQALTGLLGTTCTTCHIPDRWESDEKESKRTARRHFAMQAMLNREYFGGANAITCWTCHRGALKPPSQ